MKTSLGIWAFGPMITRFVPGGYQPEHSYDTEPVAEKVHRAVEGLGDLMDGYEFHYPGELTPDNLAEVQAALGDHDIYCIAGGLHLDPRFGRGGLVNPDEKTRGEARRIIREAAEFAGSLGAHLIIWPGGEGYNYPFQTPYVDSWRWLIEGMGEAAEICARHGVNLFLEHKNSEPAMKILMRNMGMCLFVVGKLREQGIDNVKLNMDWQHLLMNGEHLPEYAALLASEGVLGHQHANSGWGTFDDDNMVGTTAFMETVELALELRRCGYGSAGERLGFDLYPYTEDQAGAVRRSILQWRFIDGVAGRIDDAALREAQQHKDAIRAYEIVYAALGGVTPALFGIDVGTSGVKGVAIDPDGGVRARAEVGYPLSTPRPGWAEQDPSDWWRASKSVLAQLRDAAGAPAGVGLSGQMHGLVALDEHGTVLRPAILWNDQRTAVQCAEIEATIGLARLIALTGNRALPGFTAPKLLWLREHEPHVYERIARIALPKDYVRLQLCGEHATDASDASGTLLLDVADRRWSEEVLRALDLPPEWLPRVLESPVVSGTTPAGIPVAAGAGDQAAGALGVGVDRPGPLSIVLGTSGVVFAALPEYAADSEARVHAFCHAVPGGWHAMGVMLSAAGSLRWLRDAVAPGADYGDLVADAARWAPGAEGLVFLPYLAGERTPHADPDARGAFVGLSVRHDRGALVRAVLEGVAFGLRDSLDLLRELGVEPDLGRVSGGGARSELWLQIVASALELPLERVAVDEGAAFGAALLGGVAAGEFSDVGDAVAATVKPEERIEPVDAWVGAYRAELDRYRALYPALREFE